MVNLGTSCVCVCVCVANKIYLAVLPETLPTSIAEVICECKLPALSHPNSPLSNIRFHCLPCSPTAPYRYLQVSSTSLGSDPRPGITYEPPVIHSPSDRDMSDHESKGSEGASSGGEEQTPTPKDDAVNPSQRPESLQPEDEQRSTIVEHIEKPENAEEVEPNSHLPPKDPPEQANRSPDCSTSQGTSPEDRADGAGEEPAAIGDEVTAGPVRTCPFPSPMQATKRVKRSHSSEIIGRDDTAASPSGHGDASAESDNVHASNSDGNEPDDNSSDDKESEALEFTDLFIDTMLRILKPKKRVNSEHMATGEKMKAHLHSIHASVHAAKKRKEDPDSLVLDTIVVGNPGTGEPFVL